MKLKPKDKSPLGFQLEPINNFLTLLFLFSIKVSPRAPVSGALLTTSGLVLPDWNQF